jgi:hypothetical protein
MTTRAVLSSAMVVCVFLQTPAAAELKKETAAAFDRYLCASEQRMRGELHDGSFLYIDQLPENRRRQAYKQLRDGQILVKQLETKVEGHEIEVPHGLIHDWIGVLFIPKVSLAQTLAVAQDYDNQQNIYKPEVRRSKLLQHDGDNYKVFLQLYKKSLATVVINASFDTHYERIATNQVVSRSDSTRLAEVENLGQASERELPVDDGHGYLWRLSNFWRFEEKDDGVFVQFEMIGLSRRVPAMFGWLVNPLLRSLPRGILTNLLNATRTAVLKSGSTLPQNAPSDHN